MKKITVILLAVFMVLGVGTAANAAPELSFNIDFYGGTTTYLQGDFDLGETIDLQFGDTVNVDILFTVTEEGVCGGGFNLAFNPSNLSATNLTLTSPFLDMGSSTIEPGNVLAQGVVFPPGMFMGPGENIGFASFTFECLGPSLDELWVYDFNSVTAEWVTETGLCLDDQIDGIHLASISNIPIPGAVWLFGSGLIGLVGLRRRRS